MGSGGHPFPYLMNQGLIPAAAAEDNLDLSGAHQSVRKVGIISHRPSLGGMMAPGMEPDDSLISRRPQPWQALIYLSNVFTLYRQTDRPDGRSDRQGRQDVDHQVDHGCL